MKYWILSVRDNGDSWVIFDEFVEDDDTLAEAYFRGMCGHNPNQYQLVKVL